MTPGKHERPSYKHPHIHMPMNHTHTGTHMQTSHTHADTHIQTDTIKRQFKYLLKNFIN